MCRDFGAPFILLPLAGKDLPVLAAERIKILEALLEGMEKLNIPRSLAIVDCLVLSVSAKSEAASECFKFIQYCSETLKLPTLAGLSNISNMMPKHIRPIMDSVMVSMAINNGLTSAIVNPCDLRLMETIKSADIIMNHSLYADSYLEI